MIFSISFQARWVVPEGGSKVARALRWPDRERHGLYKRHTAWPPKLWRPPDRMTGSLKGTRVKLPARGGCPQSILRSARLRLGGRPTNMYAQDTGDDDVLSRSRRRVKADREDKEQTNITTMAQRYDNLQNTLT